MSLKSFIAAATLAVFATSSQAAVISAMGSGEVIDTPSVVDNGTPASSVDMFAFNEMQNLELFTDLVLDGGLIVEAGRFISSHMIFINKEKSTSGAIELSGTFGFDGDILGVISSGNGLLNTDEILGAEGTTYGHFAGRGFESNDSYVINDTLIDVTMIATQPGDWIRVVTVAAVPLPAGAVLLPGALFALGAMRRRKPAAKAA